MFVPFNKKQEEENIQCIDRFQNRYNFYYFYFNFFFIFFNVCFTHHVENLEKEQTHFKNIPENNIFFPQEQLFPLAIYIQTK